MPRGSAVYQRVCPSRSVIGNAPCEYACKSVSGSRVIAAHYTPEGSIKTQALPALLPIFRDLLVGHDLANLRRQRGILLLGRLHALVADLLDRGQECGLGEGLC